MCTSMFTLRLSRDTMSSLARKSIVMTHISSIVRLEFTNSLRGEEEIVWQMKSQSKSV